MPLNPRQEVNNRYRIVRLIGQGGFGAVYRAWDMALKRPCVLKENLDTSAEAQKQFDREAQLLASLHHNNLPRIYDYFFLPHMGQYLAMDFIEGQDLQTMLKARGRLSEKEVIPWIRQIGDAVEYMHSRNPPVIHRDIKPANIIVTPQGQAMLVDFGISKVYTPHLKTTIGARAVTPGFSPWEQYGQGTTDQRSDIYALGATLYTLLTGQEPPESIALVGGGGILTPPRQLNPTITLHVNHAIEKALETRPADRFANVHDFVQALQSSPPTRSRWLGVTGGIMLLTVILGVAFSIGRELNNQDKSFALAPAGTTTSNHMATNVPIAQPTSTPPSALDVGSTRLASIDSMVQVYVPSGLFIMGNNEGRSDQSQEHTLYLDAYWIDQTEVTNEQFAFFVTTTGYKTTAEQEGNAWTWTSNGWNYTDGANWRHPQGIGSNLDGLEDHPTVQVSWDDAVAYCQWAGRRLPTEAEWEKAARGINAGMYPWGNQFDCRKGNFDDEKVVDIYVIPGGEACDGYVFTSPVGNFLTGASPYGALDMVGNVWEWVADWYNTDYYQNSPLENPPGPALGVSRVLRGGSWNYYEDFINVTARHSNDPAYRINDIGFRCAQGS